MVLRGGSFERNISLASVEKLTVRNNDLFQKYQFCGFLMTRDSRNKKKAAFKAMRGNDITL